MTDVELLHAAADELEATIIGNDAEARRRTEMCAGLRRLAAIRQGHPGLDSGQKGPMRSE